MSSARAKRAFWRNKSPQATGSLLKTSEHNNNIQIETQPNAANLSLCNPQEHSRLFSLPAELRNLIFELATAPYVDSYWRYDTTDFCYRPGYEGKNVASYSLLLTCRLAWLEWNASPMLQAEHAFWFKGDERRPEWTHRQSEEARLSTFLKTLTHDNKKNLTHVHFFSQLVWLENRGGGGCLATALKSFFTHVPSMSGKCPGDWIPNCIPQVFTLTIRHFDWWGWEEGQQLELALGKGTSEIAQKSFWLTHTLLLELGRLGVPTFKLELETLEHKVDSQLRPIVAELKKIEGDPATKDKWPVNGATPGYLMPQQGHEERTWSGPATAEAWPNGTQYARFEELKYRIITVIWKRVEVDRAELFDNLTDKSLAKSGWYKPAVGNNYIRR